jgi:hypothetical protein
VRKLRICNRRNPTWPKQGRDALVFVLAKGDAVDLQRLADDIAGRHAGG